MFFVAGVTGQVGGATAERLLAAGRSVRTVSRDPAKARRWCERGVEVVVGDLTDPNAFAAALDEVEGAFLLNPPLMAPSSDYREAKANLAGFEEALRRCPPPRLVVLSSVGSEKSGGTGNIGTTRFIEKASRAMPFPVCIVRAGGFIENYLHSMSRAAETGWLDTFYSPTERPLPTVATADLGTEIARLLIEGWSGRKIVEVGSYRSPDEVAAGMSEVFGSPVRARAVPRDRWPAVLEAMGLPAGGTGVYEEMMDGFNSGWIDWGAPGAERIEGRTTPEQVFVQARKSAAS